MRVEAVELFPEMVVVRTEGIAGFEPKVPAGVVSAAALFVMLVVVPFPHCP